MNNLPSIQINHDINAYKKFKFTKLFFISPSQASISNIFTPNNINGIKNIKIDKILPSNSYDYFNTSIPKNKIEKFIKSITDEKFLFFLKYGILRRFEGECEIIYIEIPQIPKKLIVYRLANAREKSLENFILNNRDLPSIPLFENEDKLKYLSLESNHINKIEHLISLNNLIYLNLYGNNIREIENLNNVKNLKILLLSRNNISEIKNLNMLNNLEVLDLHSNKIKYIQGLQSLKKLKEINLSNNLLCSFHELIYNKNLEDINLRKNLISTLPNFTLGIFDSLKKLNLSKNLINKIHFLEELTKLKSLKELYLDYNPIINNPDSSAYIKKLPIKEKPVNMVNNYNFDEKKNLVLKKGNIGDFENNMNKINNSISGNSKIIQKFKRANEFSVRGNRLRKSNQAFSTTNFKKFFQKIDEEKCNKILSSLMSSINIRNFSPDFSKTKPSFNGKINLKLSPKMSISHKTIYKSLKIKIQEKDHQLSLNLGKKENNIDEEKCIKKNIKILAIINQWKKEYNNIIKNGYNGYSEIKSREITMNQGYIEVDGDKCNCLTLFGNCLKILSRKDLCNKINCIKFHYFNYDLITCKKYFGFVKMFKDLKKLYFEYNNIFSLYQLIKLESFENLESIYISNNEVCCSEQFVKLFVIYRMKNIKTYNNSLINFDDKVLSNQIFSLFDNLIFFNENQLLKEKKGNINEKEDEIKENVNNKEDVINYYDDSEDKFLMWNFVKQNLSTVLFNIVIEEEE